MKENEFREGDDDLKGSALSKSTVDGAFIASKNPIIQGLFALLIFLSGLLVNNLVDSRARYEQARIKELEAVSESLESLKDAIESIQGGIPEKGRPREERMQDQLNELKEHTRQCDRELVKILNNRQANPTEIRSALQSLSQKHNMFLKNLNCPPSMLDSSLGECKQTNRP